MKFDTNTGIPFTRGDKRRLWPMRPSTQERLKKEQQMTNYSSYLLISSSLCYISFLHNFQV